MTVSGPASSGPSKGHFATAGHDRRERATKTSEYARSSYERLGKLPRAAARGETHQDGSLLTGAPTFLTSRIDTIVNWSRRNSLWPMPFGTACCAIEMMAAAASRYDMARFGMERMSFSPRQADVLICAGRVPYKLASVLRRTWDQMPQPKWCVSMGACASSGGVFDVYSMVQGIDTIVPVDVYIPGCPPRPEALIYGLMMIQEQIREETLLRHHEHRAEDPTKVARPEANDAEIAGLTGPFGNSMRQERLSTAEALWPASGALETDEEPDSAD